MYEVQYQSNSRLCVVINRPLLLETIVVLQCNDRQIMKHAGLVMCAVTMGSAANHKL